MSEPRLIDAALVMYQGRLALVYKFEGDKLYSSLWLEPQP